MILLVLVLATRFLFLSYPAEVVFDEVHFGKFVSAYFTHKYYFDIHPPLGKLMIAGIANLFGFNPENNFEKIGEAANARILFSLRFLPALFGSLFVLVIYKIILVLGGSRRAAFLGGFLIAFDNAFLVESKFVLVDSFLFFFGFSSLLVFLLSQRQENRFKKHLFYFSSMALAGLAFSIKWTGLSFLGINLLFSFFSFLKTINLKRFLKFSAEIFISLALFALVYVLPFAVHFKLLPLSGPGDAFMSQGFQETLTKGKYLSFGAKFIELNQKMFAYNANLEKSHPDASRWNEWPFMRKPVWYWEKNESGKNANIYLVGNPLVWIPSFIVLFSGIFLMKEKKWQAFLLLFGFLANFLPFIFVKRAAFVYHYLPALTFAVILFSLWWGKVMEKRPLGLFLGYLSLVMAGFLIVSPLSYGLPISAKAAAVYKILVGLLH